MQAPEPTVPSSPAAGRVGTPAPLVTPVMVDSLQQTKPWVMFFAVLGFIGTAMMIMMGVIIAGAGLFGAAISEEGAGFGFAMAAGGFLYVVMSALYFFGSMHLYRYAKAIGRTTKDEQRLSGIEDALDHQRAFWRFAGLSTVGLMTIYVVFVFAAFLAGIVGGML